MDEATITSQLDELYALQQRQAELTAERRAMVEALLADMPELDALDAQIAAMGQMVEQVEQGVRTAVLLHGKTVSSSRLQAVWNKGRESWDTKALSGYAAAHPEILTFKTVGTPTVSIRAKK